MENTKIASCLFCETTCEDLSQFPQFNVDDESDIEPINICTPCAESMYFLLSDGKVGNEKNICRLTYNPSNYIRFGTNTCYSCRATKQTVSINTYYAVTIDLPSLKRRSEASEKICCSRFSEDHSDYCRLTLCLDCLMQDMIPSSNSELAHMVKDMLNDDVRLSSSTHLEQAHMRACPEPSQPSLATMVRQSRTIIYMNGAGKKIVVKQYK